MPYRLILVILLLVALVLGCSDRIAEADRTPLPAQKIQEAPQIASLDVRVASSIECSTGGLVYTIFFDANSNQVYDSEEVMINKFPICNGRSGVDGKNGHGVAFASAAASAQVCPSGGTTIVMATDLDNSGIYSITAPNQQAMTICNGSDGVAPAYAPVEPIMACGNSGHYKEILLRLSNGQILSSFSKDVSGTMTRLAFLPDGVFINTDESGCQFELSTSEDGKNRSISWSGTVQKTWPINY